MKHLLLTGLLLSAATWAACAPRTPVDGQIPPTAPLPATAPQGLPSPAPAVQPTAVPLSFAPATYRDDANGFELDYPAEWSSTPNTQIGSRGSQALLLSPGASAETLPQGATRVTITIYLWDPKGDLASYATHRKSAWDGSQAAVEVEQKSDLVDGRQEMDFIVKAADGARAFFLLTTLGDHYLEIAGEGDLGLVQEIARTLRPVDFKP